MIFDALTIAGSALKTNQKAMDVISHNISNANTPGYSRQRTDLVTQTPDKIGLHQFGRGVDIGSINRLVDPLIDQAQMKNTSQQQFWNKMFGGLNTVENVFGSLTNTGLSSAVNDFFSAWQQLSNNPQDQAQRYNVRTKSESVATHLTNMSAQLVDARRTIDGEIDANLVDANLLLDQIASLTSQISRQEGVRQGVQGQANDLRDQRDTAIRKLSALIPIQQVDTQDGGFLIQTMGGDLLTQHDVARHLTRSSTVSTSGFKGIVIQGTNTPVAGLKAGGAVGGLITLRDDKFTGYLTELDSMAANLVFGVNQIHANGAGTSRTSTLTSGKGALSAASGVNDAAQGLAFASKVVNGTFDIHVYDATGAPLTPVAKTTINITATDTMTTIAANINNVTGITASVDVSGRLVINAGNNTVGFAGDSSNFLAAYEVNSFFNGTTASEIKVSDNIIADVGRISTGRINAVTSLVQAGDNTAAIAIMALEDQALSFDGSTAASIHDRISVLSANYGNDVAGADRQRLFRASEADSLKQQRAVISGVSIDEELIQMIKFQRAYESSAKVIQTTNQMLDALMGILR